MDDELPESVRDEVASHLASCPTCAASLESARLLSRQMKSLADASPPADLWAGIETALRAEETSSAYATRETVGGRASSARWWAIAASLLVLAGAGLLGSHGLWDEHDHEHDSMTATFDVYLAKFAVDPEHAHETLIAAYNGRPLAPDQVGPGLGGAPIVPRVELSDFTVQETYVLDMPCCQCTLSVCRRPDGGVVSVLEHLEPQPTWFGGRPQIECLCDGKPTSVVQVNQSLAASWRQGNRYLTAIGARDLDELTRLVADLDAQGDG